MMERSLIQNKKTDPEEDLHHLPVNSEEKQNINSESKIIMCNVLLWFILNISNLIEANHLF